MRYLSNIYNPVRLDAKYHVMRQIGETQEEAWRNYQQWLKGKIIGKPKGTETYNVEELERMNYVSVYINDD